MTHFVREGPDIVSKPDLPVTPGRVLIIDDDPGIAHLITRALRMEGYEVVAGSSLEECRALLRESSFDALLLDQALPDGDGTSAVVEFARDEPAPMILVMTGHASVERAVEAVKNGAFDYITKPFAIQDLCMRVRRAIEHRSLRRRVDAADRQQHKSGDLERRKFPPSNAMRQVEALARRYAVADSPVLILGETGVGKDRLANFIHRWSGRTAGEFLTLDCAGLHANLVGSELFGHERGAFTGADSRRQGLMELAHRGTLFLDEAGELTPDIQAMLLRAIETKRFRRLGGSRELYSDFRAVAATNRDLSTLCREGRFRSDLFYRISALTITIPPLRERPEDITWLAMQIMESRAGADVWIEPGVMEMLTAYAWPGNIRELRNVIERSLILNQNKALTVDSLHLPAPVSKPPGAPIRDASDFLNLRDLERSHILDALVKTGGNKSAASRLLGIPLSTLKRRLKSLE